MYLLKHPPMRSTARHAAKTRNLAISPPGVKNLTSPPSLPPLQPHKEYLRQSSVDSL